MRYLRLMGLFIKSSLLVELEYRANFLAQGFLGVLYAGVSVASILLFFSQSNRLGGWSLDEALIIVGLFTIFDGLLECIVLPNIKRLVESIRNGAFDFTLLKPINSQFLSTLRYARLNGLADMAVGAIVIITAIGRIGYRPSPADLLGFGLTFGMACLIIYSIQLAMATTAFWFVKVDNFTEAFRAVYDTARFPVTAFRGGLRIALTFVAPIAFMTTVPAQAVLGRLDAGLVLGSLGFGLGLFAASAALWRHAIRSYSSASS